ncbi:hypothetical protein ACFLZ5_05235 [Thermodesulfobacteriota bacterium]
MNTFSDIFQQVCQSSLERQAPEGSMPAGHNGPYCDPETPVRNTAHWIQTFICAFHLTGEEKYRQAAKRCADYLIGKNVPRSGSIFRHREKPGKDSCNGLIGPAWTIEGLCAAYDAFGEDKYLSLACDYFTVHPFSTQTGLWKRVEPDGTILSEDWTFNHQLWFCMSGALLYKSGVEEVYASVNDFISNINKHLTLSFSGRITHSIWSNTQKTKQYIKWLLYPESRKQLLLKEVGYHAFNLYAFSVMKTIFTDHPFWDTKVWNSMLKYLDSREYVSLITKSIYGFPYNPPGFEILYVNQVFGKTLPLKVSDQEWLQKQINLLLHPDIWQLSRNNNDPETLTARLYECSRFSRDFFSLPIALPKPSGEEFN